MGIGRFFVSLVNEYPDILIPAKNLDDEHIMVDFNSLIHDSFAEASSLLYHISRAVAFGRQPQCSISDLIEVSNLPAGKVFVHPVTSWPKYSNTVRFQETAQTMVANRVVTRLKDLIKSQRNVKTIGLYIDGVPHIAKMLEQRARRLFGHLAERGREEIVSSVPVPSQDSKELMFERDIVPHLSISRNVISPGTQFMANLVKLLNSKKVLKLLQSVANNRLKIDISTDLHSGEAEHKIMHKLSNVHPSRIAVYSPDADMIVLLLNDGTRHRYNLLRRNHETGELICLPLQTFRSHLCKTIIRAAPHMSLNFERALRDVCFIYNLFGNDFLPPMSGIRVDQDFAKLTRLYVTSVLAQGPYITKGAVVDWVAFARLVKALSQQYRVHMTGGNQQQTWQNNLQQWVQQKGVYRVDSRPRVKTRKEFYSRYFEGNTQQAVTDYLLALRYVNCLYVGKETRLVKFWFYPHHKAPFLDDVNAFLLQHCQNLDALLDQHEKLYFQKHPIRFEKITPLHQHLFTAPTKAVLFKTVRLPYKHLSSQVVTHHFKANEQYLSQLRWEAEKNRLNVSAMMDCSDQFYLNKCLPMNIRSKTLLGLAVHPIDLFNAFSGRHHH